MINAIADYTKSIVRLPRNPAVLLSRGTEYRERKLPGDPVRAVDDLTQAISLDDTIANGYYARGLAYFEVGEDFYIDALAGLLHAHEFRPDDPDSNRAVCWLLVVTEQADSAIPYCDVAVDGGVDDGYFTRGTACLKINDSTALPKAVSDFTEAIRKDPFSLKAYMNRGSAYFKLGEVHCDQSIADLKHILTIDPAYRSALNNLCWNMSLMGRSREGLTYCDRAINISPD